MKKKSLGKIIKETDSLEKVKVKGSSVEDPGDYKKTPVHIYYEWCKKCGICVAFCPTGTLAARPDGAPYVKFPDKCIHCERCDMHCPDYAITGAKTSEREENVNR